jgi:hypothetical protein
MPSLLLLLFLLLLLLLLCLTIAAAAAQCPARISLNTALAAVTPMAW